jgi:hypothetical protein
MFVCLDRTNGCLNANLDELIDAKADSQAQADDMKSGIDSQGGLKICFDVVDSLDGYGRVNTEYSFELRLGGESLSCYTRICYKQPLSGISLTCNDDFAAFVDPSFLQPVATLGAIPCMYLFT